MEDTHKFDFNGQLIEMPERGIAVTSEWKATHAEPIIDTLFGEQSAAQTIYHFMDNSAELDEDRFTTLFAGLRPILDKALNIDEIIVNAVIDWIDPDSDTKDHLLENVSPKRFVAPLKWIFKEIYPLEELMAIFSSGTPADTSTPSSLPGPNGDGRPTKPRRRTR